MCIKSKTKYPHGCKTASEYEEYKFLHPTGFYCKECGKFVDTWRIYLPEYSWKIKRKGRGYDYYCSYNCMRKVQKKQENLQSKQAKSKLLNKYNGELSLKECQFMEDILLFLNDEDTHVNKKVSNRKEFLEFIRIYYNDIKRLLKFREGKQ